MEFTEMEKFKLAVLSERISDDEVLQMALNFTVNSEDEIRDFTSFLRRHRPQVMDRLRRRVGHMS